MHSMRSEFPARRRGLPPRRGSILRRGPILLGCALLGTAFAQGASATSEPRNASAPAQLAYRHGVIYTVDAHDRVRQALAVRDGRIVYVGDEAGLAPYLGPSTRVIDLGGRTLMPGLVDGHMHPLEGGANLLKCNLNYEPLTLEQLRRRIQACLDASRGREPDGWLEAVGWFQEAMLPPGTVATRAALDSLATHRPIYVMSSFGHTVLANSRALTLGGITARTPDPLGGHIGHDAAGEPNGLLEDAAQEMLTKLLPQPTAADDIKSARAALEAMSRQGITTFLDARAVPSALAAFAAVEREGGLTARAHFALLIEPPEGREPGKAVARVRALADRFDRGQIEPRPGLTVRNIKLFLDGVIAAPALTGAMLEPYLKAPADGGPGPWVASTSRGPEVYFPASVLREVLIDAASAGFEPHMHADGDRAVHEGLDGIEALRRRFPGRDIRAAIAHDEIVDPKDFPRYRALNVIPVLSFQWEKPAPDTIEHAQNYLGPARFKYIEPAGFLAAAGARVAFGSDWPVDALDEWFALKVGITRTNAPTALDYRGRRLSADPGLTRAQALRAITMNSSYELHQDTLLGSLEIGKLADLIVLDRNLLEIPAEDIAQIHVLQTVVGGRVVYEDAALRAGASR
jgi:predicted amidohydrolase YtcJ